MSAVKVQTPNPTEDEILNESNVNSTIERAQQFGDYFRDLSLNYSDYSSGRLPWPARPEGLVIVEPVEALAIKGDPFNNPKSQAA